MNQRIIIAISREYGSGGRTIGEMLSKDIGIPYYDKDIIPMAAEESGINEALFHLADEDAGSVSRSGLFKTSNSVYTGELLTAEHKDFTSEKNLFNYQAAIIKKLADTESCIIVGRCADYILHDRDNVVSVFIHAPQSYLLEQAAKKVSMNDNDLEKYVNKINRSRSDYYECYTGKKWADAHHFDICLDSSRLGFEKCVEIIKGYMKVRFDGLEF